MKRCPNCEFIYEDDQSLCDMDGQTLVHDHAFSVLQPRISAESRISRTSSLKSITLPACAGVLLAALLFVGYYYALPTSLNAKADAGSAQSPAQNFDLNSPVQNLFIESRGSIAALESVTPQPSESETTANAPQATQPERDPLADKAAYAHFEARDERFPIARSVPPLPRLRPLPRLPHARPLEKKPNSAGVARSSGNSTHQQPKAKSANTTKKDSKLGSFLKKSGRILTKPFKL
jgi:hypothetical protein